MLKRILLIIISVAVLFSFSACEKKSDNKSGNIEKTPKKENGLHEYKSQEFEISALSGPQEMSEEAFKQYKDAGFNVFAFSVHTGIIDSDNRYYFGSKRTEKALELCKKVGLDAYVAYGVGWATNSIEGEDYFSDTPFSQHNYYSDYMDIIRGIRIIDEPRKQEMLELSSDVLINDFKKVYQDKKYMINLIPATAVTNRDFTDYDEMLKIYGENIMSKFEKPYISVDVYPFAKTKNPESMIIYNYNEIAKCAKKYNAETTMILQSSTGNEFLDQLSEDDMRLQAYLAIAFGADNLQYYCYSVPADVPYNYCMLEKDNKTPSELYYHVQKVNQEVQKFASAVLSYDWNQSLGVSGTEDQTFRVCSIEYDENFKDYNFESAKHYISAEGTQDLVVSQFTSKKYGEAYMFVNFGRDNGKTNTIDMTFKDCTSIAVYGGKDYSGTPEIIKLKDGKVTLDLQYGEGVFVVPLI